MAGRSHACVCLYCKPLLYVPLGGWDGLATEFGSVRSYAHERHVVACAELIGALTNLAVDSGKVPGSARYLALAAAGGWRLKGLQCQEEQLLVWVRQPARVGCVREVHGGDPSLEACDVRGPAAPVVLVAGVVGPQAARDEHSAADTLLRGWQG